MMSMLRAAATSVAGSAANRLRARGSFLAPLSPQVLAAPSGPARPYRYTPPVQVRCQRRSAMGGGGGPAAAPPPVRAAPPNACAAAAAFCSCRFQSRATLPPFVDLIFKSLNLVS